MEVEISGRGGDRCGHGSWIVGLVGDGDIWVFLGFSGGGLWLWRSVWPRRLVWVLDLCLQV